MGINEIVLIEREASSKHIYSASRMPCLLLPLLGTYLNRNRVE